MKKLATALIMSILVFSQKSLAQKNNTDIYEKEPAKTSSLTAKVRSVREDGDDPEVYFESDKAKGSYTFAHTNKDFASKLETLRASAKAKGPAVSVTLDMDNKAIIDVQKSNTTIGIPVDANKEFDKLFH